MIYLWVAAGGALGSVARFWLNSVVVGLTGAMFPWGTLAINVIGSFLISFFAVLTSKAARFAVPPEISIFFMVGICGGFTTFSSFSLQTVELARDGEWQRAAAYVLGSLILCLLVCWLGVAAALAIAARVQGAAAIGAASLPSPTGAILAVLPEAGPAAALLTAAERLAAIFHTRFAAVHIRVDPATTIVPEAEVLTRRRQQTVTMEQATLAAGVAQALAAWRDAHPGVIVPLFEPLGGERAEIAGLARAAALVVPLAAGRWRAILHAAVFEAGCPVLALPPASDFRASHIAIGWKNTAHARRAIAAAMPLIAQARRISVIGIGDPARLQLTQVPALLGRHAGRARLLNPPPQDRKIGRQLLDAARAADADLLVLGAHRHGEVAGWALGGVTHNVLEMGDFPLFLKH